MSGECDHCGEHALECTCEPLCWNQQNGRHSVYGHLDEKLMTLDGGEDPPAHQPPRKIINVHGREEHEAILKNAEKCQELGLDQMYEIIVYLNRWGGWLSDQ